MAERLNVIRPGERWEAVNVGGDYRLVEAGRPGLVLAFQPVRNGYVLHGVPLSIDLTPAAMAVEVARVTVEPAVALWDTTARATALLLACVNEAGRAADAEGKFQLEAEAIPSGGVRLYLYRTNGDEVDPQPGQLVGYYVMGMDPQPIPEDDGGRQRMRSPARRDGPCGAPIQECDALPCAYCRKLCSSPEELARTIVGPACVCNACGGYEKCPTCGKTHDATWNAYCGRPCWECQEQAQTKEQP